jgi:hypothetical protein
LTLFTLLDAWASELDEARANVQHGQRIVDLETDHYRRLELDHYRDELRECRTMADVDAVIALLSTEPGPVLQQLRSEEYERRFGVRREGNVVFARFGGARG